MTDRSPRIRTGVSDGLRHWYSLVGLGIRRIGARATGDESQRLWVSIGGVTFAVALLLVVTGVGLGLAADSTIHSDRVDYWITKSESASSNVVSSGDPKFGGVHGETASIRAISGVESVTPVLVQIIQVRAATSDEPHAILALGIIPTPATGTVAGMPPMRTPAGDPFFENGSYDGEWTGDVVLSSGAATLLNASSGTSLRVFSTNPRVAGNQLTVVRISENTGTPRSGRLPVALFRLSELQALTGANTGDQADQFIVKTDSPGVKSALQRRYPDATIVPRTGVTSKQLLNADLPLAMSLTATVIAVAVGLLFVATTMGMELTADRRQLAMLAAVGFSRRDRAVLVVSQTLCLTLAGGIFGVLLGRIGIELANFGSKMTIGVTGVAMFHPALAAAGLGVAVLIGFLTAPYLYLLTRRTTVLGELTQ